MARRQQPLTIRIGRERRPRASVSPGCERAARCRAPPVFACAGVGLGRSTSRCTPLSGPEVPPVGTDVRGPSRDQLSRRRPPAGERQVSCDERFSFIALGRLRASTREGRRLAGVYESPETHQPHGADSDVCARAMCCRLGDRVHRGLDVRPERARALDAQSGVSGHEIPPASTARPRCPGRLNAPETASRGTVLPRILIVFQQRGERFAGADARLPGPASHDCSTAWDQRRLRNLASYDRHLSRSH